MRPHGSIERFKNMIGARDNYRFIAQNIAAIYTAIGLTPFGSTLDEEHRLYATGLIDIVAYLQDGSMSEKDVADSILWGSVGEVGLGFYNIKHREMFESEENQMLVGFAMQLEAFIFQASVSQIGYRDIVESIIDNKGKIADTITKTLKEGPKCSIFHEVMQNVVSWAAQPEFQKMVNDYQRINDTASYDAHDTAAENPPTVDEDAVILKDTMFCTHCGTQLPSQSNFCYKCGFEVTRTTGVDDGAIEELRRLDIEIQALGKKCKLDLADPMIVKESENAYMTSEQYRAFLRLDYKCQLLRYNQIIDENGLADIIRKRDANFDWESLDNTEELGKDARHMLSYEEIPSAFKKLVESAELYTFSPPAKNSNKIHLNHSWHSFQVKCSKCGNEAFPISACSSIIDITDFYQAIADKFSQIGYNASLSWICEECLNRGKEMPMANLVFSLTLPGLNETTQSFPRVFLPDSFPYDVTLAFIKGATTVEELSNVCGEKRSASDYLEAIKMVLGDIVAEQHT